MWGENGRDQEIISDYVTNLIQGYFDIIIIKFSLKEEELRQVYEQTIELYLQLQ